MSPARVSNEKTCPACGLLFRWRNDLDLAWRDQRFCSSSCQRRAGLSASTTSSKRPTRFPDDTLTLDRRR